MAGLENTNGIEFQPYTSPTYRSSLANSNQVPSTGLQANYLNQPYDMLKGSLAEMGSPGILGDKSTDLGTGVSSPGAIPPPPGNTPFFNGGSVMGNIGQGMNLIGSGVSLVGMLQNMKDARKNNKINRSNIQQQMSQSETAFNRDVERQDGTSEAIRQRNERVAQMNQ